MTKPSDTKQSSKDTPQALPDTPFMIIAQYTKDLSFENPNIPEILTYKDPAQLNITINVTLSPMNENLFTVDLIVKAESKIPQGVQFVAEITFGALVKINETVAEKFHKPLLLVEVPRMLFPFVRNILVDITRDGGFSPLLMQPIDFGDLYRKQLETEINNASADIPKH